jgi:hypothetical protein
MIDVDAFYAQLGAQKTLSSDEQLQLREGVRVMCEPEAWTLIFEDMRLSDERMVQAFEVCGPWEGVIPLTTRSGHLAFRHVSLVATDNTLQSLAIVKSLISDPRLGDA